MAPGFGRRAFALSLAIACELGCKSSTGDGRLAQECAPGTTTSCICPGGQVLSTTCMANGSGYAACACGSAGTGVAATAGGAGTTAVAGTSGAVGTAGTATMGTAGTLGSAGTLGTAGTGVAGSAGVAGSRGAAGSMGAAGTGVAAGGTGAAAGSSGAAGGNAADPLDSVRQLCVDTINMYRATMSLPPLMRETPDIEACSDKGAKQDSDANMPHGSAGMCFTMPPYYGAGQNTCPSLPVGGFGAATLADALKQCLAQMWAEGPPPAPKTIQDCINDYSGCFLQHGHYINMIQTMYKSVSCGFYKKADGSYWGNQDFPVKF